MDTKNIKIRKLIDSDLIEIQKVVYFHNNFLKDNRTIEQWQWEYKQNYPDLFVFTVLEDDGKIKGTQAMIPIYLNIKGEKILTGKSENSLIDPKFRGTNYFQNLYEFAMSICKEKKMKCIWGYTSAVKVWRKKLGFQVYETMYNFLLVLHLTKAFSKISRSKEKTYKKFVLYFLSIISYIYTLRRFLHRINKDYEISQKLKSLNDLENLFVEVRQKYPNIVHIHQDSKYIDWRINNNPVLKYETNFVYKNNKLVGYCYGSKKNKTINLTDFTFIDNEGGKYLLSYMLKKWKKEDTDIIIFFGNMENPLIINVFNLLKKFGFIKKKLEDAIVIKNISLNDNSIFDIKNWYMNGLWTEGYST